MDNNYTALVDLGDAAVAHLDEVNTVKKEFGITHGYYDAWIYGFLENKKFNIQETIAKLNRRFAMEVSELGTIKISDFMKQSLRKGIIQEIGIDKAGRVAFYIYTKRDVPQKKYRHEQRNTFDMFVSYGSRLRKENKRCQLVMLINQDDASMFKNVDMTFQADVALRISKFYPGMVDKMYIINMNGALAAMAKPIFKTLPAIVSDRIQIVTSSDIKKGVLLDLFDENVLPTVLGGKNDCDNQEHFDKYADNVESYFTELQDAVNNRGLTVKEWELEKLGLAKKHKEKDRGTSLSFAESLVLGSFASVHSVNNTSVLDQPLQTCCTEDFEQPTHSVSEMIGGDVTWATIMQTLPRDLAVFFLDELLRWREDTEEMEEAERAKIQAACDAGVSDVNRHSVTESLVRQEKVKASCSCFSKASDKS